MKTKTPTLYNVEYSGVDINSPLMNRWGRECERHSKRDKIANKISFIHFNCFMKKKSVWTRQMSTCKKKHLYFSQKPYKFTLSVAITCCNLISTEKKRTNTHTRAHTLLNNVALRYFRYYFHFCFRHRHSNRLPNQEHKRMYEWSVRLRVRTHIKSRRNDYNHYQFNIVI